MTYHDVGYTLKEARYVQKYEQDHNPDLGPFEITRCDTDHSGWVVIAVGPATRTTTREI